MHNSSSCVYGSCPCCCYCVHILGVVRTYVFACCRFALFRDVCKEFSSRLDVMGKWSAQVSTNILTSCKDRYVSCEPACSATFAWLSVHVLTTISFAKTRSRQPYASNHKLHVYLCVHAGCVCSNTCIYTYIYVCSNACIHPGACYFSLPITSYLLLMVHCVHFPPIHAILSCVVLFATISHWQYAMIRRPLH